MSLLRRGILPLDGLQQERWFTTRPMHRWKVCDLSFLTVQWGNRETLRCLTDSRLTETA